MGETGPGQWRDGVGLEDARGQGRAGREGRARGCQGEGVFPT